MPFSSPECYEIMGKGPEPSKRVPSESFPEKWSQSLIIKDTEPKERVHIPQESMQLLREAEYKVFFLDLIAGKLIMPYKMEAQKQTYYIVVNINNIWRAILNSRAFQVVIVVKNLPNARDVRDTGSIPGSGRPPGGGPGSPLQCSCLENPLGRGAWKVTIHRVAQSQTLLKWLSTHSLNSKGISKSIEVRFPDVAGSRN